MLQLEENLEKKLTNNSLTEFPMNIFLKSFSLNENEISNDKIIIVDDKEVIIIFLKLIQIVNTY